MKINFFVLSILWHVSSILNNPNFNKNFYLISISILIFTNKHCTDKILLSLIFLPKGQRFRILRFEFQKIGVFDSPYYSCLDQFQLRTISSFKSFTKSSLSLQNINSILNIYQKLCSIFNN